MASNSSGSFCAAFGCSNSKSRQPKKHFFRFPKDKERCKRWVINCRRKDLQKRECSYLNRNCRLCDDHFTPKQFMNEMSREKLVWNAIPTVFHTFGKKVCTPVRKPPKDRQPCATVTKIAESLDNSISTGIQDDHLSCDLTEKPKIQMLLDATCVVKSIQNDHPYCGLAEKPKVQRLPNANYLATKIVELQRKLHVPSDVEQPISIDKIIDASIAHGMQPAMADFFRTQLLNCSKKKKGHRWTIKDKRAALGIFYKSKQAYRTLSSSFVMPSPCTLRRYNSNTDEVNGLVH